MNNTHKIYLLALITFVVSTSEGVIAGILDQVAASAQISLSAAGQLITVFAIANAIGSPLVIAAASRLSQRKILISALLLTAIGSAMTVFLPGFALLMLSRVVLAIGSGVFAIAAKNVASELAEPGRQASAIGTVLFGFSAAIIIGLPIGRLVSAAYDWRMIFAGIGLLGAIFVPIVAAVIPSALQGETLPIRQQLRYLRNPDILAGLGITFFWQLGYGMMYAYIAPFLLVVASLDERSIGPALFAFGISTLIGSKFGGWAADRAGNSRTLIGSLAVHAMALALLAAWSGSAAVTVPLLMLWSFAAWASGPGMQLNLIELAPQARGIMLGLYGSFIQLGIAAAGGLGGVIASGGSVRSIGWAASAAVGLALGLAGVSLRFRQARRFG